MMEVSNAAEADPQQKDTSSYCPARFNTADAHDVVENSSTPQPLGEG